ncbi:GTPase-activating protein [Paenibacillus polymyxa]|uniref:GTPase-activating protein n=1 Tax=Paenibacillus polymyxa TaxID=1406 RepID=UPI002ED20335|nr:GTPase-activating protein [Paenibacillus polymyxa]
MSNQTPSEIAKEITIAAIEKGFIIAPANGSGYADQQLSHYNQKRAEEIGAFYKIIAKSVNESLQGR